MDHSIIVFRVDGRKKPPYSRDDVLDSMQLTVKGMNDEEAINNALETARHFERGTWVFLEEKL